MINPPIVSAILFASFTLLHAAPAFAAGEILITQAKANAGNVTPGDAPGFPVTLSRPGLYVFASNIYPTANKVGVHITTRYVTIDLNGFELNGNSTATFGIAGGNSIGATIRNGTITRFKFDGVISQGEHWKIEDLRVNRNGRTGINGYDLSVMRSNVSENTVHGVECNICQVESSVVSENGAVGVRMTAGMVLSSMLLLNTSFAIQSSSSTAIAYGNNYIRFNNGGGAGPQVEGVVPMHPNQCFPGCP